MQQWFIFTVLEMSRHVIIQHETKCVGCPVFSNLEVGLLQKRELVKGAIASTLEKMLEEVPYNEVTIAELMHRSGFSVRTFYNHFSDINDAIAYIWKMMFDGAWYREDGSARPLRDFWHRWFDIVSEKEAFFANVTAYVGQNSIWEVCLDGLVEAMIDSIHRQGYIGEIDDETIDAVRFYAFGMVGVIFHYSMMAWQKRDFSRTTLFLSDGCPEIDLLPERIKPYFQDSVDTSASSRKN